jgi:hypothetical protein
MPKNEYLEMLRKQIITNADASSDCWKWTGTKQKNGYGSTRVYGRVTPAHRAAYIAFVGDISDGNDVCHICDVRDCVNPVHLFQAGHAENMRDMSRKGRGRNGVMSGAFVPNRNELGQFTGK